MLEWCSRRQEGREAVTGTHPVLEVLDCTDPHGVEVCYELGAPERCLIIEIYSLSVCWESGLSGQPVT